jgi:hypothetical protein
MPAAHKLKTVEPEPALSPARQPLLDAMERVAELKRLIEENQGEQDKARAEIRAAERDIEDGEKLLASAPALQRRSVRKRLEEAKEAAQDWRDHLDELQRKGGTGDYIDAGGSLAYKLRAAENDIKSERSKLLQSHPRTLELLRRLGEIRGELNHLVSDLYFLERAGGIPKSGADWVNTATMLNDRPPPDAGLVEWIEALLTNPGAELPELPCSTPRKASKASFVASPAAWFGPNAAK